jgi:hypothetical protein
MIVDDLERHHAACHVIVFDAEHHQRLPIIALGDHDGGGKRARRSADDDPDDPLREIARSALDIFDGFESAANRGKQAAGNLIARSLTLAPRVDEQADFVRRLLRHGRSAGRQQHRSDNQHRFHGASIGQSRWRFSMFTGAARRSGPTLMVAATALIVQLGSAALLRAQAVPTFPVTGVVQDQTGGVLLNAVVELVRGAVAEQSATTDASGTFRFEGVRAGNYELRVRAEGFSAASVRIRVASRAPAAQKIVLQIAQMSQEITVSDGGVTTSAAGNRDAIAIDPDALEHLPIFDQDIVGTAARFLDQAALGTGGVTLVVDGMEAASAGVSASAIESIRINQDPYSAEYARPGRGRIEIVTKAGTQAYHAAGSFTFRDARLNSRDPFALEKAPEQRRIFEGSISGPAIDGKTTSFLASVDRREEDVHAVVYAIDPSGLVQGNVPQPRRDQQVSASVSHQHGESPTM